MVGLAMIRAKAFLLTYLAMWLVPIPVYGLFAGLGWIPMPDAGDPSSFYLSVSVIKAGFALGFVGLFPRTGSWRNYAMTWWVMFVALEIGQVLSQMNPVSFAVAGILSEAGYFPLSALLVSRAIRAERGADDV